MGPGWMSLKVKKSILDSIARAVIVIPAVVLAIEM